MGLKIVVDSSVLLKWVKTRDEQLVDEARQLLSNIEKERIEVHVPALLLYEVGNALLLKTQLGPAALQEKCRSLRSCHLWSRPRPTLFSRAPPV
jgi:predicted nucleic acid-binding protein